MVVIEALFVQQADVARYRTWVRGHPRPYEAVTFLLSGSDTGAGPLHHGERSKKAGQNVLQEEDMFAKHARKIVLMALVAITLMLMTGTIQAAPGDLDPSFGSGGIATIGGSRRWLLQQSLPSRYHSL